MALSLVPHAMVMFLFVALVAGNQAGILESARMRASRAGTEYGGWTFDAQLLNERSVVYSIGLGTDISWDKMVIKTVGCHVHGFDDTPISNRFLERHADALPRNFHWHRYVVSDEDRPMTLMLPNGFTTSFSAKGVKSARGFQKSSNYTAQALTLRSMMKMLNHSSVDVLKMDVEGFEFRIFNSLLLDNRVQEAAVHRLPVCQLLLEFHSRLSPLGYQAKADALLALQSLGFTLLHNVQRRTSADDAYLLNPRFCSTNASRNS